MDCAPVSRSLRTMPISSSYACASCAVTSRSPKPGCTAGPPLELRRRVSTGRRLARHAARIAPRDAAAGFALQAVAPQARSIDASGALCALHFDRDDAGRFDVWHLSNAAGGALCQHDGAAGSDDFLLRRVAGMDRIRSGLGACRRIETPRSPASDPPGEFPDGPGDAHL